MQKSNKGNRQFRTQKQKDAAQVRMLFFNPMFKPENKEKQRLRMLGRKPPNPFPKGNVYWIMRKSRKQQVRNP